MIDAMSSSSISAMALSRLAPEAQQLTSLIRNDIAPKVNRLRRLQGESGCILADQDQARNLLDALLPAVREAHWIVTKSASRADAFTADVEDWRRDDFGKPRFDRSLESFSAPLDQDPTFFVAPFLTLNGPSPRGYFMECFVALRDEPSEYKAVAAQFPHSQMGAQSMRLLTASVGLMTGNCIALFPENVATSQTVQGQKFALCFQNKFHRIFTAVTLPAASEVWPAQFWHSGNMTAEDFYKIVCVRSYFHDYFHHSGPRPLYANLQLKRNFYIGVLEELKVDCQTVLAAVASCPSIADEVSEFVLLERMLRYPKQPDMTRNFDAASGIFLFEWLLKHHSGISVQFGSTTIDFTQCVEGIRELVKIVLDIEANSDDGPQYRQKAKDFVRTVLPESNVDAARFALPEAYNRFVYKPEVAGEVLDFDDLAY